jgi:hypothetical protein
MYILIHTLEIRTTENGKCLCHCVCKSKNMKNSQKLHGSLVIIGGRLNRHNLIPNTSIKIAAFCHMRVCSLVQIHKNYIMSVAFCHSTSLVIPHSGDLHIFRPNNLKPRNSINVLSSFVYTKHYDSCAANTAYTNQLTY